MAVGIETSDAPGVVIANNRVGNAATGPGASYGVFVGSSPNAMVKDNTISVMNCGIYFDSSAGLYMNNLATGCMTAFTGGTAAGSTNYSIP